MFTRCPPCKAIAPLFDQLASKNTIPSGLAFAKVDVDAQKPIAQQYGIRAMPTFMLMRNGKEVDSVKGANASAIRELVKQAKTQLAEEKLKQGEVVDQDELENDGVDESTLPKSGLEMYGSRYCFRFICANVKNRSDFMSKFAILILFLAYMYYTKK